VRRERERRRRGEELLLPMTWSRSDGLKSRGKSPPIYTKISK
jgi:hypothetical protein